ncbi:MAG: ribose 5-phosphate isomerase [Myxococcales bacterium SG8_38_1]|jgi:ribose 5-phosphate isomerase B|nr:MAG: ribose 5-phosphate isomerase [Myxococcales bacterium SG8_38_1]
MASVLIVGSDHAGLELKRELASLATELGYEVRDVGTHTSDSTDYPDYAHRVASAVAGGQGLGLLVCGTGIGMSMAANRHPGVRAAVCGDVFSASMTRQHNDANVLCIGSRVVGGGLAGEILKAFLGAAFEGGRHERRVNKIELSDEG